MIKSFLHQILKSPPGSHSWIPLIHSNATSSYLSPCQNIVTPLFKKQLELVVRAMGSYFLFSCLGVTHQYSEAQCWECGDEPFLTVPAFPLSVRK